MTLLFDKVYFALFEADLQKATNCALDDVSKKNLSICWL